MKTTFYFDPICPFSWITSRWLLQVSAQREINVSWQPFSLAIKNGVSAEAELSDHDKLQVASLRLLRVMVAAEKQGAKLIDLYTTSGIKRHVAGFDLDDEHIKEVLAENKLPEDLLKSADDSSLDEVIEASMKRATDAAGQDIGVPSLAFSRDNGQDIGYFGPVINQLPELQESLDIWDGLSKIATTSSFYELKRARPDGLPDIASTAKC